VVLHDFDQSLPGHWTPNDNDLLMRDSSGYWTGFFPGVAKGDRYRFWTVGPSGEGLKRDPRALELELEGWPNLNCIVGADHTYPWHDAGFQAPAFSDLIVYQLHVGVFYAVDDQGNDIRKDRVSKFLDVLDRLEHLVALGVNAIEPLPVVEWQGEFSRGYNNSDFFSPEMEYTLDTKSLTATYLRRLNSLLRKKGLAELTLEDISTQTDQLKAMVDLCHVYGLAVIFDVVYNHAGGPLDDQSLRFFDRPWNRQWWDPDLYFVGGNGWAGGRIFDYHSNEVRAFLIDNARYYVNDLHADGLRFDEVTVIRNNDGTSFCRDLTNTLHYERPNVIQIAEYWDWDRASNLSSYEGGVGLECIFKF
jgi:1,4-alpha-glucan branching enzyme